MKEALFGLRKFLPTFFMPLGLSLILILIGLLRRRRVLVLAGFLLLFLASLPAVSNSLGLVLEDQYPHLLVAQCSGNPHCEPAVFLSRATLGMVNFFFCMSSKHT